VVSTWNNRFVQGFGGYRRYLRLGSMVVALRPNRRASLKRILNWLEKRREQEEIWGTKEYCSHCIEV
jgi:hypothetical protein